MPLSRKSNEDPLFFSLPFVARVANFTKLANRYQSRKRHEYEEKFQRSIPFGGNEVTGSLSRVFYLFERNRPALREYQSFLVTVDDRAMQSAALQVEVVVVCFAYFFDAKDGNDLPELVAPGLNGLEEIRLTLDELAPDYRETMIGSAALRDEQTLRELMRRIRSADNSVSSRHIDRQNQNSEGGHFGAGLRARNRSTRRR